MRCNGGARPAWSRFQLVERERTAITSTFVKTTDSSVRGVSDPPAPPLDGRMRAREDIEP
jgi:hypothetical protein